MHRLPPSPPLSPPPHLSEVCEILARGLLRLRSRTSGEIRGDTAMTGYRGEFDLHSVPQQRVSAARINRRAT